MNTLPLHINRKEIPEYHTWKNMRARCNAPCNQGSRFYQSKGITVCERWDNFENFYADMGKKPTTAHSIDRINNDGNYEPSNCRWANHTQQANNKSNNKLLNYEGAVWTIPDLARHLKVSIVALRKHLDKGRSVEEALNRMDNNSFITYNGEKKSRKEWSEIFGIKIGNIHSRLNRGWSVEKTLTTKERRSPNT